MFGNPAKAAIRRYPRDMITISYSKVGKINPAADYQIISVFKYVYIRNTSTAELIYAKFYISCFGVNQKKAVKRLQEECVFTLQGIDHFVHKSNLTVAPFFIRLFFVL